MGADLADLPFDTVTVTEAGERRVFTPAELLALPLHTRVRWLLDETLEFHRGGTRVDRREALAALRNVQVEATVRASARPKQAKP